MVTIADLISGTSNSCQGKSNLIVSSEMPVRDVLARMEESGDEHVGVELEGNKDPQVLSRQDLLDGLLREVDRAGEELAGLQKQIGEEMSVQLDLVRENARSMADIEKNKLEVAIDYMTEGLVIIDNDRNVNKCNPAARKFFGLNADDSVAMFSEVFDDYGFREMFSESVSNTVDSWGQFKMKSPSGAIIQIRWTEMIDECGDVIGNLVMLRDVTDELAGEKAKTEFIAAITHELRTPLTIIQNSVSNILAGVTGRISKKMRKYLETIQGDCKRFGILVSDLLDISKLEAGNMLLNRKVMNLGDAIDATLSKFSSQAIDKGIEIIGPDSSYITPIYADIARIDQLLFNLIGNALKFCESGDKVTVSCYQQDKAIVTVVEDTGAGISQVHQKQLFSKFEQIGRQAGAGYKGMGLGLAICKGITEMHGGEIWIESEQGKGSKLFFSLPKIDPAIILNRHLETLVKNTKTTAQDFGLILLRFEVDKSQRDELREVIGTSIKKLLDGCGEFLTAKNDLALEINDFEVVFAVSDVRNKRLDTVKGQITEIVKNINKNDWNDSSIVPMMGLGIYPADSNEIIEIENLARKAAVKMYQ